MHENREAWEDSRDALEVDTEDIGRAWRCASGVVRIGSVDDFIFIVRSIQVGIPEIGISTRLGVRVGWIEGEVGIFITIQKAIAIGIFVQGVCPSRGDTGPKAGACFHIVMIAIIVSVFILWESAGCLFLKIRKVIVIGISAGAIVPIGIVGIESSVDLEGVKEFIIVTIWIRGIRVEGGDFSIVRQRILIGIFAEWTDQDVVVGETVPFFKVREIVRVGVGGVVRNVEAAEVEILPVIS